MKLPAKYMFTFAKETCKRTFRFSNFISRTPFFIEHLPWLLLNLYEYRRTYLARKSFFFSRKISYPSKRLAEDVKNHEDVYLENIWENII